MPFVAPRRPSARRHAIASLCLALCLAAVGGMAFAHGPDRVQPSAAKPAAATSPEELARRNLPLARFDTGQVTVGEIEDAIVAQSPFMQKRYLTTEAVHALLERSLRFELLAAEAQRRGYAQHKAVRFAVRQNAVQAFIKHEFDDKLSPEAVPAADVKQYYQAHLAEFVRGETRRASVLIVPTEQAAKLLSKEVAGADLRTFREVVRTKSSDETNRQRGGDLRYFDAKGRPLDDDEPPVDPVLAQAAFALKNIGDTSGILHVADKFAILKLTGQRPAEDETLQQADQRIRMRLWRERRQAAIDAELERLRKQLQVEVHPELVELVHIDDSAPTPPDQGLPSGFPATRPEPLPE